LARRKSPLALWGDVLEAPREPHPSGELKLPFLVLFADVMDVGTIGGDVAVTVLSKPWCDPDRDCIAGARAGEPRVAALTSTRFDVEPISD